MSGVDCLRGTWAAPAASIAVIDRNSMGNPACWAVSSPTISAAYGFDLVETNSDITTDDYFCLTRIDLPTGGYESYTYEEHDYYYFVADKNGKTYFTKTNGEHETVIADLKTKGLWFVYE